MNDRLDYLHEAVEADNVASVKEWIDAYRDDWMDVERIDSIKSPIWLCVNHRDATILDMLGQIGFSLVIRDQDGCTLLMHAAFAHNVSLVKWLLTMTDLLEEQDYAGWNAFHYASMSGSIECAYLIILESGCKILEEYTNTGLRPIHIAAQENNCAFLRWLISRGAQIDSIDSFHSTALMHAATCGHLEACALLSECKANKSLVTWEGRTAEDLARRHGYLELARLLNGS